jgi:hypothetical protein
VAAEARRDPDAVTHAPEDRLVVRRDVVDPLHERRKRHEHKLRQQLLEGLSHIRTPAVELHVGIADRAEVTREEPAVTELFRSKAAFR